MGRRRKGEPIHGWLAIDKDAGQTSARVVGRVLAITGAAKAGHGGTLDPMATGVLPVALGEATKTVSHVMDGSKTYRFTVRWGESRDTDDAEGGLTGTSEARPAEGEIRTALAGFTGAIEQVPPAYAAVKIKGERAYDLARRGQPARLEPRRVVVESLALLACPDADHAEFEMCCGKGTYVRALARDLAQRLGTLGHISALRRLAAGPFDEKDAISLEKLEALVHSAALFERLYPVETALADIPALAVTEAQADRIRSGQAVHVLREDSGLVRVASGDCLVALAEVRDGRAHPVRVFNLWNG